MRYEEHYNTRVTPQSEQSDAAQKANNAGGYAFTLDDWGRLRRFLILGSDGGTYYVGEKKLTRENALCVERCVEANALRTVEEIASLSESGRAPKNDAAIFALAICAGSKGQAARGAALEALTRVCRTGTHLFQFVQAVEGFRGWGRGLRRAIGGWYGSRTPGDLAYQVLKYQQRGGWSHKDLLRLAHFAPSSAEHQALLRYVIAGTDGTGARVVKGHADRGAREYPAPSATLPKIVEGFERIRSAGVTARQAASIVAEYELAHEMVPSQFLGSPEVWGALLERMPMTAMIRNLGRMTANGLIAPLSEASQTIVGRLGDVAKIRKARVHPLAVLIAQKTYAQGHGDKGKLTWSPASVIVDALDAAFYASFEAVEPSGKATLLALDVSGSMDSGAIAGSTITPREGAAVMAMATARREPNHHLVGFTAGAVGYGGRWGGASPGLTDVPITSKTRLDDACALMRAMPMGGTDCALPMTWANSKGIGVDVFAVYTDCETWAGPIHPHQALEQYRRTHRAEAKLAVVGMTATEFTIAKPGDHGMLDVVGFDASTPSILADFSRGALAPSAGKP